jgi:hypothetical protein
LGSIRRKFETTRKEREVEMIFAVQANEPERLVGYLAIIALGCFFFARFVIWLLKGPREPDPWGEQIAADLAEGNCTPVCHRCLTPHDSMLNFCPECGAPVGKYTNLLPFPRLFSLGHTLRIGTSGGFKRTPLIVGGFILLAIAEYAIFAPVYWVMLFRNILQQRRVDPRTGPQPPVSNPG